VNEEVIKLLKDLHAATVTEYVDGDGPVLWILLIPSTKVLMQQFIRNEITEDTLFQESMHSPLYNTLYLCSASVLPEYRRRGLTYSLTIEAIKQLQKDFPIDTLFYWPFSKGGKLLATKIATNLELTLFEKASTTL
jgi:hypothetical protein